MADNTSPEEQNNEAGEEFPQKLRVHALARLLGLTSKEVLAHLGDLGFVARSAHSSIDRSAAERVRDRIAELAGGAPDAADQQVAPEPATAPLAEPVEETPSLFSEAAVIEPIAEVAPPTIDTTVPLFLQPEQVEPAPRKARAPKKKDVVVEDAAEPEAPAVAVDTPATEQDTEPAAEAADAAPSGDESADDEGAGNRRRRRGRRGRGRGRGENADEQDGQDQAEQADGAPAQGASTDEQQPEEDSSPA
ncbi:translation initiation factor IF-2 N-terminal domain-containing protein, partial [Tsukamurella spumae]